MKTNTLDLDTQALQQRILDLAMQGKLVKQYSNDEPASELLNQIEAEKAQLIKEKKIKRSKPLPEITDEEKPFDIPDSWEWVRLGMIGTWAAGGTPSRKHPEYYGGNIPWLKTGDLNDGIVTKTTEKITKLGLENSSVKLNKPGNILIAMYGATIGKLGVVGDQALVTNQACCGCTTFHGIYNWYLFYYLLASRRRLIELGSGGAQPNISKKKIEDFVFPLPPLSEQKRIAVKIDQLFALIQKIETAAQQYDELKTSLKSKVLDLAMQGKLVKQDSADEPASVLLDEIKSEKDRLVKEKRIRNSKPLPEITDNEKPYDIPNNWEWVRLGDIIVTINGDRGKNYPGKKYWQSTGRPFLNAACLTSGKYIDKAKFNYISDERYELLRSGFVNSDDILYCIRGSLGKVGMVNIDDGAIASSLIIIRKIIADQNMEFLYYLLCSSINGMFIKNHRNGTAQPNIPGRDLLKMVVPLPPLEEQKRIVDKLEKIFAYL